MFAAAFATKEAVTTHRRRGLDLRNPACLGGILVLLNVFISPWYWSLGWSLGRPLE